MMWQLLISMTPPEQRAQFMVPLVNQEVSSPTVEAPPSSTASSPFPEDSASEVYNESGDETVNSELSELFDSSHGDGKCRNDFYASLD